MNTLQISFGFQSVSNGLYRINIALGAAPSEEVAGGQPEPRLRFQRCREVGVFWTEAFLIVEIASGGALMLDCSASPLNLVAGAQTHEERRNDCY